MNPRFCVWDANVLARDAVFKLLEQTPSTYTHNYTLLHMQHIKKNFLNEHLPFFFAKNPNNFMKRAKNSSNLTDDCICLKTNISN